MKQDIKKIMLSILVLLAAGISPNLFVISQAGIADLSSLAVSFLIPSIILIILITAAAYFWKLKDLSIQIRNGFFAGILGTIGLEVIRETGFHLGGMPGDLPKLMGILLLNQFAAGPDTLSNIAGWSYHFWNGAAFGIIYSIIFGRGNKWLGIVYGVLIGVGFMMSPVVVALGAGHFGVDFGWGFPLTVTLAHIAFGFILGWLIFKWNDGMLSIFSSMKSCMYSFKKSSVHNLN